MRHSIRSSKGLLVVTVLLLGLGGFLLIAASPQSGVPASVWSMKGNRGTDPGADFLGTTDNQPLIVKTNASPVLTLGAAGPVEVHKNLVVHGDTTVDKDLHVSGGFTAAGGTSLSGSLALGGDLSVAGQAQFAKDAQVGGSLTAGMVHVSGTTTTGVLEITGGDLAEPFPVSGSRAIPPGAVVIIDDLNPGQMTLSHSPYDRRVAGVVSGAGGINPGVIMYREGTSNASRHVALTGRVYALADASTGSIRPGDLLTTSALPGHVMKVTDYEKAHGAVVGKAISSLATGTGLVLVLVTLQ